MVEVVALYFYVKRMMAMAEAKGRSRGWGGAGLAAWLGAELIVVLAIIYWNLSFWLVYPVALFSAAVAAAGVYFSLKSLPVTAGLESYFAGVPSQDTCPSCGSLQTGVFGHRVRCFSCDYLGPAIGGYS